LLGAAGQGFRYLMRNLQRERLMISIAAQAAAEQILEKAVAYSKERRAFGSTIAAFQHNAFKIVERATEVELGRTFLDAVIEEFMAGEDITRRVSMAKWWLSDVANRVAYDAVQLRAATATWPVPGGFATTSARDADLRRLNEVMKLIIARMMGLTK
jgi:acyl-CoA dehydrogenase